MGSGDFELGSGDQMIENVAEKMADNEDGSGQFGNSIVHSLTKGISFLYM